LKQKIRILVIDASLLFRETIARGIEKDPWIEVVGTAVDPFMARDMILKHKPDVLTLDVELPKMSGIEFLKRLMPQYPLPVVAVSSLSSNVFDALNAGAVDFITKPNLTKQGGLEGFIKELIIKIKIAASAKVGSKKNLAIAKQARSENISESRYEIIAIGASAGGTEAIYEVIKTFPKDMPGVVIVQHMPPVFTRMYAERLNNSCSMEVKEAQNGDLVVRGKALVAPGDFHMKVKKGCNGYFVECKKGERVNGHCPSVDILFNSISEIEGISAIGVILTGMGNDGAKGLLNMKEKGAYTIGQNEQTSVVYGMPKIAYEIGAVLKQTSLENISEIILSII